jgi:hypothetical protein
MKNFTAPWPLWSKWWIKVANWKWHLGILQFSAAWPVDPFWSTWWIKVAIDILYSSIIIVIAQA